MCRFIWDGSEMKIGQRGITDSKIKHEKNYGAKPQRTLGKAEGVVHLPLGVSL